MYYLPQHNLLQINLLAGSFNNTSSTYKFYWFISLLEELEKGNYKINKQALFANMIANAWYTVNYFHVSFGVQDQLQRAIEGIKIIECISIDEKKSIIQEKLKNTQSKATSRLLWYFDGEVPYRFLSPWFPKFKGNKKEIYKFSKDFNNDCLYSVDEKEIVVNPKWVEYLVLNSGILKAFCYWHLSLYLQKYNPNVPDIPNKLIRPAVRSSLVRQRKYFWDKVIEKTGTISCIYTSRELKVGDYAVEHFLPYAFVSHDLLWNLIPADKIFNNSKSDKLPSLEKHFEPYFQLQKLALQTFCTLDPNSKFLEDYLPIIPDLTLLKEIDDDRLRVRFKETVQPLLTIASNNGFEFLI